jgi:uncharacterized membrane protein
MQKENKVTEICLIILEFAHGIIFNEHFLNDKMENNCIFFQLFLSVIEVVCCSENLRMQQKSNIDYRTKQMMDCSFI